MGISMGAFHTLFIAAAEDQPAANLVQFDRYVALYPPVRLSHGMEQLDAFYNAPLVFPEEEREERVIGILQKVLQSSGEWDLKPGTPIPLSQLTNLLGAQRVTFYPGGGHMGNLHVKEVQNDLMDSLQDLL